MVLGVKDVEEKKYPAKEGVAVDKVHLMKTTVTFGWIVNLIHASTTQPLPKLCEVRITIHKLCSQLRNIPH